MRNLPSLLVQMGIAKLIKQSCSLTWLGSRVIDLIYNLVENRVAVGVDLFPQVCGAEAMRKSHIQNIKIHNYRVLTMRFG